MTDAKDAAQREEMLRIALELQASLQRMEAKQIRIDATCDAMEDSLRLLREALERPRGRLT